MCTKISAETARTSRPELLKVLDREIAFVAYYCFLDRFLYYSTVLLTGHDVRVASATALFLAIKVKVGDSIPQQDIDETRILNTVVELMAHGHFTVDEVMAMEKRMLEVLEWKLNGPTMHQFVRLFSELHPLRLTDVEAMDYIYEVTRHQVELVLLRPQLLMTFKPSVIALACMLRAEEAIGNNSHFDFDERDFWKSLQEKVNGDFELSFNGGFDACHVHECQCALEHAIPTIPTREQFQARRQAAQARREPGNDQGGDQGGNREQRVNQAQNGGDPLLSPVSVGGV